MSKKTLPVIFLGACLAVSSSNAFAWCCCAAGAAASAMDSMHSSVKAKIAQMTSSIIMQLQTNGRDTVQGLEGIRKATAQASTGQTEEMINQNRINEREKALYEAKLKVIEDYGNPPESVCADAGKGAIVKEVSSLSKNQASKRRYIINGRILGTSFSGHKLNPEAASFVSTTEIAAVKDEDLIIDRLGDPELDEPSRRKLLALATDPRPPAPLDDNRKSTAAGRLYEALRKERVIKMSAIGAAFSEISRQEAPADGKDAPSLSAMLEQLVEDAYPSAAWHGEIQAMGRTDLLRETVKQLAVKNYLLYQRYRIRLNQLKVRAAVIQGQLRNYYDGKLLNYSVKMEAR